MQREVLPKLIEFATDRFANISGGYAGADKDDPYRKFDYTTTLSPDSELDAQLEEMQMRCAMLYKNDPLAPNFDGDRLAGASGRLVCDPPGRAALPLGARGQEGACPHRS